MNNFNKAIKYLKQAIEINPEYPRSYLFYGLCASGLGDYKTAEKCYLIAIKLNKYYAQAYYNLAITYLNLRDKESAVKVFNILKEIDSDTARELTKDLYNILKEQ